MRIRTVTLLTVLPVLTAVLLSPRLATSAGATASAARTCGGQAATIVSDRKARVQGTAGDDVIWARDASRVRAAGGDDLICVVHDRATSGDVDAGSGDDVVRTSGRAWVSVQLGRGSDTLAGSETEESVDAGDALDVAAGDPPGHDEIRTGAGNDVVDSGAVGTPNADAVDLGSGDDVATLVGTFRGTAAGGTGDNIVRLADGDHAAWHFDLAAGTAAVNGATLVVSGFGTLDLNGHTWSSLTVSGSRRGEIVYAGSFDRPVEDRGPVHVRLLGGRDLITIGGDLDARLSGGTGRDVLDITSGAGFGEASNSLEADLARGRYRVGDGDEMVATSFSNLWAARFRTARATGTAGANEMEVEACVTVLRGLGGDDELNGHSISEDLGRRCRTVDGRGLRAFGGTGDDELHGGSFADRLLGGRGRDTATGWGGKDRCFAEVERSC